MSSNNCLFCEIINQTIPCHKIYEDEQFLAFLDIFPADYGHILLIPKQHFVDIIDVDQDTGAAMMKVYQRLSILAKQFFNADGINLINNSGKSAGQEIFHTHMHIICRYDQKRDKEAYIKDLPTIAGDLTAYIKSNY